VGFDGALSDVQPRAGYQQPIDQTSVGAARSPRAARLGRPAGQPADQLLGPFGGVADLEAAEFGAGVVSTHTAWRSDAQSILQHAPARCQRHVGEGALSRASLSGARWRVPRLPVRSPREAGDGVIGP
jgi:hypothetical protein